MEAQALRDSVLMTRTVNVAEQDIGRGRGAADPSPAMHQERRGPVPRLAECDEVGDVAGFRHDAAVNGLDDVMHAKAQMPVGTNGFGRRYEWLVE